LAAGFAGAALSGAPAASCEAASQDSAAIVEVTPAFELRLDDGRLIRPVGLAHAPPGFAETPAGRALRAALNKKLKDLAVFVAASAGPDRWGRLPATLAPVAGGQEVGAAILAEGAGRIEDIGALGPCGPERRVAEGLAREAGKGLWGEAYYAPIEARDRPGLLARAGEFVVVEGRVARVGMGRRRIFMDFDQARDGFSVTMTRQARKDLQAVETALRALVGRRARVRGVIETFETAEGPVPRMEASSPAAIEALSSPASEAR
jgi:hypothetical protein